MLFSGRFKARLDSRFGALGKIDSGMPRQYLLGRFPFIGEDGELPSEDYELPSESSWLGSATLPGSYAAIIGVGPFFTSAGAPINVAQVLVEEWIETNGQPPHWWIYRHWLYVYYPYLITDALADRCARVVRESALARSGVLHYKTPTKLFNGFDFAGATYTGGILPELSNSGALVSPGVNIPSIRGARLATTVADGAMLGGGLVPTESGEDAENYIENLGGGRYRFVGDGNTATMLRYTVAAGKRYQISLSNVITVSGSLKCSDTVDGGVFASVTSDFSTEYTITGDNLLDIIRGVYGQVIDVTATISIKEVIPTYYDTDISGNPLNPESTQPTRTGNAGFTSFIAGRTWKDYNPTDPAGWGWLSCPARTNKCTCRKANPVDTTGLTKSGDAAAVLSIAAKPSELLAARLNGVCTLGNVYKVDNSLGTTECRILNGSSTAGSNSISAFIMGGTGKLGASGSVGHLVEFSAFAGFTRVKSENKTLVDGNQFDLRVNAGQIVYFILSQLEEGAFSTPPIYKATDGTDPLTSLVRAGTVASYPTAGKIPVNDFAIRMIVVPRATGQSAYLMGSYVDANNYTAIVVTPTSVILRKMVAGVQTDATVSYTHSNGVPVEVVTVRSSVGMRIAVRQYSGGTWSAWTIGTLSSDAAAKTAAQIGAAYQLGSLNSANQFYGNIEEFEPLLIPPGTADPMAWAMATYDRTNTDTQINVSPDEFLINDETFINDSTTMFA